MFGQAGTGGRIVVVPAGSGGGLRGLRSHATAAQTVSRRRGVWFAGARQRADG